MHLSYQNKLLGNSKTNNLNLLNTKTAYIISKSKNFSSLISTWGDKIYFKTPIKGFKLEENARDTMDFGEIAYWVKEIQLQQSSAKPQRL